MTKEERLAKLKTLLGINGADQDAMLEIALETVEGQVLSYIHQDILPLGLEKPLLMMTVSYWKGAGLGNDQVAPGPITSVKRGDVSTSFASEGGADSTASTFGLGGGDGFFGWRTTLNAYRKVRWRP